MNNYLQKTRVEEDELSTTNMEETSIYQEQDKTLKDRRKNKNRSCAKSA